MESGVDIEGEAEFTPDFPSAVSGADSGSNDGSACRFLCSAEISAEKIGGLKGSTCQGVACG